MDKICAWNGIKEGDLQQERLPRVEKCVHDFVAEHAAQFPESTPAVCGWDASFTYQELNKAAGVLARHLAIDLGVIRPEVIVPLCFEKSAWTVVASMTDEVGSLVLGNNYKQTQALSLAARQSERSKRCESGSVLARLSHESLMMP